MASKTLPAVLALLLNACIWGVSWWPFRQLQHAGLHPLWSTCLLYGVALVGLLVWRPQAWRGLATRPALWLLLAATGLTNVCFNWAVAIGDVVRVVLLFYLMPGWAVLLAWLLLGERPTRAALLRLALAVLGVAVVVWPADGFTTRAALSAADLLALLGGLAFALTNVLLKRQHQVPGMERMCAMFLGGVLMAGSTAALGGHWQVVTALPALDGGWAAGVAVLGLLFFIGNMGLQYGASRLPSATTAIVMLTEVVFASASSIALGAATLSLRTAVGAALVLLAALWAARSD